MTAKGGRIFWPARAFHTAKLPRDVFAGRGGSGAFSRRVFLDLTATRRRDAGITKPRFQDAYLPDCFLIEAALISGHAGNGTVSHAPIAMGV